MPPPTPDTVPAEFSREVRAVRRRFFKSLDPHRPALWRYCRSLTGDVWDAEDLTQETLLRAFAKLGEVHWTVKNPRSYLLRIATNLWIDQRRRAGKWNPAPDLEPVEETEPLAPEVREALSRLAVHASPQERVAVLLKDVFGFSLDETAAALTTTRGAVKAALHRGRRRLSEARDPGPSLPATRPLPSEDLVDAFVDAFNARDLDRLAALFAEDAEASVIGMVQEYGREQIKSGSLHHTVFEETGEPTAERIDVDGLRLVVLWCERDGQRAVEDLLLLESREGALTGLDYYYFCPEALAEVTETLGLPLRDNGYRYPMAHAEGEVDG